VYVEDLEKLLIKVDYKNVNYEIVCETYIFYCGKFLEDSRHSSKYKSTIVCKETIKEKFYILHKQKYKFKILNPLNLSTELLLLFINESYFDNFEIFIHLYFEFYNRKLNKNFFDNLCERFDKIFETEIYHVDTGFGSYYSVHIIDKFKEKISNILTSNDVYNIKIANILYEYLIFKKPELIIKKICNNNFVDNKFIKFVIEKNKTK
jgi:hypothetical protein